MSDETQTKVLPWYSPDEIQLIQRDLLGSAAKILILCLGGKGGVGKTTIALQSPISAPRSARSWRSTPIRPTAISTRL